MYTQKRIGDIRFTKYIQQRRLLPYFWKFSCLNLRGWDYLATKIVLQYVDSYYRCIMYIGFCIFVVRTNHENIFTTKISRSTVDDNKVYNSCNNKVANTREIDKLQNQGWVLVYTQWRVNDNKIDKSYNNNMPINVYKKEYMALNNHNNYKIMQWLGV